VAEVSAVWAFIKAHWQLIVLALVVGIGYGYIKHQQAGFADALSKANAANAVEVSQINAARAQEEQQHQKELQDLQTQLGNIQQQYAEAQQALQAKQATEEVQIVKQYGNDTSGLAQLVAQKFGFVVVTTPSAPGGAQ
jgi:23S rRNA pseudoU1915 N3-methylase RlmH